MLFLVYGRYGNAFPLYTRYSDLAGYFSSVRTLYLMSSILFPLYGLYNDFPVHGRYNAFPVYGRNNDFQVYGRNNYYFPVYGRYTDLSVLVGIVIRTHNANN